MKICVYSVGCLLIATLNLSVGDQELPSSEYDSLVNHVNDLTDQMNTFVNVFTGEVKDEAAQDESDNALESTATATDNESTRRARWMKRMRKMRRMKRMRKMRRMKKMKKM